MDPQTVVGMLIINPLDRKQRSVLAFSVTWPWEKSVMPDAQALGAGTKRNFDVTLSIEQHFDTCAKILALGVGDLSQTISGK
jgi:hypothetical protein